MFAPVDWKLHITHFILPTSIPLQHQVSIRLCSTAIMARLSSLILVLSAWFISSSAQFGFFDQMFGNQGQHQHQEPQNVRSDSSWYQAQYEGGMSPSRSHSYFNITCINDHQHNAHTTSAPALCRVFTSHTIVPARGRASKIKRNWAMGLRFVGVRVGGRMGSLRRRSSWRGRVCYEWGRCCVDTLR
jgi:hypothetical protein